MVIVGGVCSSLDWSSLVLSFLSPCEQCCCCYGSCWRHGSPLPMCFGLRGAPFSTCFACCRLSPHQPACGPPLGLELWGRLFNPRKRGVFIRREWGVLNGEQQWRCLSCGNGFTGGKKQVYHTVPQPVLAMLAGWCRCVFAATLGCMAWKLFCLSN